MSLQGILGVIDGVRPLEFENDDDKKKRHEFLRMIGEAIVLTVTNGYIPLAVTFELRCRLVPFKICCYQLPAVHSSGAELMLPKSRASLQDVISAK
jgi:hypothetical protein